MDENIEDQFVVGDYVANETVEAYEEMVSLSSASVFFTSWKIYTAEEAFKPRPPRKFLVSGLLPQPGLVSAFGRSGDQKSLLLMDMCVCIAAGIPWLPSPTGHASSSAHKTVKTSVLWLDFDNGKAVMDERIEAAFRGHSFNEHNSKRVGLHYITVPDEWLDLAKPDSVRSLAQMVKALSYKLIVIDNLGSVEGGIDENSSKMAQVMGRLRWLVEFTQATVIFIHHPHKDYGGASNIADLLRGHSSILAALDAALLIERDATDRSRLVVRGAKSRGSEIATFGAKLAFTHRPSTEELLTSKFYGYQVEDKSIVALRLRITEMLTESGSLNQNAIVSSLVSAGASKRRVFTLLETMENEGKVNVAKGPRGAKVYSLSASAANKRLSLIKRLLDNSDEADE